MYDHYPFHYMPLPYVFGALEPYISRQTMHYHYEELYKKYVDNLNRSLKPYPQYQQLSLKTLLINTDKLPSELGHNIVKYGGGVYNHQSFFLTMSPTHTQRPFGKLADDINSCFGSYDSFKETFVKYATNQFGSGYTWLLYNSTHKLQIMNTNNQDTPPLAMLTPVLLLDVWEHGYYLDYKTERMKYAEEWFNVINYDFISRGYNA